MGKATGAAKAAAGEPRQGRREEILDAASRRLNAVGVSLGSLADIAGALGLSRAALYAYVEDREDLVFQCYRRSCAIMRERLEEAMTGRADPFQVIAAFISNVLDPDRPEAAAVSELGCLGKDQQSAIRAAQDEVVASLADILAAGQSAGRVRRADPDVAAHAIVSLVYWIKLAPRWLAEEASLPKARLEAAAQSLLFDGVASRPVDIPDGRVDLDRLAPRLDDAFDRKALAAVKLDRMLATASRLFNQRGVDTTSIEEIAAELGVTKRTVYNHFPDKLSLISACQLRGYRIFTEIAEQARGRPGPRAEAVGAATYASVLSSFRHDISPLRVLSGLPDLPANSRALAAEATARLQGVYRGLFEEGLADGSLRAIDHRPVQMAMAGVSSWVAMSDAVDPAHVAREIAELVLLGLKAR